MVDSLVKTSRQRTVTLSEGLNTLGVDVNGSNSAQESSSDEGSDDSSDGSMANKPGTSRTVAQHEVFRVHKVPEEVFEQGHVIDRKIYTEHIQNKRD